MTAQTVDTSKLWDMIKDIRFGMLTVRGADGRLHSRPMTTQNGEADHGGEQNGDPFSHELYNGSRAPMFQARSVCGVRFQVTK